MIARRSEDRRLALASVLVLLYVAVFRDGESYFALEDRDGPRAVREKLTGKLVTLDRAQEGSLPALLSLLDVPHPRG